jgi:hypothetical protein
MTWHEICFKLPSYSPEHAHLLMLIRSFIRSPTSIVGHSQIKCHAQAMT